MKSSGGRDEEDLRADRGLALVAGKVGWQSRAAKSGGNVERHGYGRIEGWRWWPATLGGKVGRKSWAGQLSVSATGGSRAGACGRQSRAQKLGGKVERSGVERIKDERLWAGRVEGREVAL
jgi:hypothetical protein